MKHLQSHQQPPAAADSPSQKDSIAAANRERDARAADAAERERQAAQQTRVESDSREAGRAGSKERADETRREGDAVDERHEARSEDTRSRTDAKERGARSDETRQSDAARENRDSQKARDSAEDGGEDADAAKSSEQQTPPGTVAQSPLDTTVAELGANLKSVLLSKGESADESPAATRQKTAAAAAKTGAEAAVDLNAGAKIATTAVGADAAELKKFAERVAAARADLKESGGKPAGAEKGEAPAKEAKEAKIDAASGGLRVELDSAKWQLNGRVYGDRGGQENIENKVAGLMDRYVKSRGANAKDSGARGNESGQDNQQQQRGFANRLNDLQIQGGDVRDANQSLDQQARLRLQNQEELARENRRLFNELVERARVNVQSNGSSTASIRMNPAALGRMTLNLEVHQNQVHARILVDSDAAKRVLVDEMDHLRQELSRQGITVESLSVRVRETANMSFMQNSDGAEHSALDQQTAGGDDRGDDGSANNARSGGDEQSMRAAGEEAGREYDLSAGAPAGTESRAQSGRSAVNISI